MAALGLAAAAGDTVLVIGGTLTVSSFPAQYTIESEQIAIIGGSAPRWSVQRGLNGSAKAAHAAGTALTAGWGGGGDGGVTVDNGVGTLDAELHIEGPNSTGDDILRIDAPVGYHQSAGDGYLIHVFAGDGTDVLNFDPSGTLNITSAAEEGIPAQIALGGTGEQVILFGGGLAGFDRLSIAHSSAAIFRVTDSGVVVVSAHAAPADNVLLAGEIALWFDQTDGAAKLMLKGKTANGTVRVGEVNLS